MYITHSLQTLPRQNIMCPLALQIPYCVCPQSIDVKLFTTNIERIFEKYLRCCAIGKALRF